MQGGWRHCLGQDHGACSSSAMTAALWPVSERRLLLQVCDQIMQRLHDQCVVMLSQDSFYRGLTREESKNAACVCGQPLLWPLRTSWLTAVLLPQPSTLTTPAPLTSRAWSPAWRSSRCESPLCYNLASDRSTSALSKQAGPKQLAVCGSLTGCPVAEALAVQAMRAVNVPIYDFSTHSRSSETRRVEPADVVIIEGILVLAMSEVGS